MNCDFLPNDQQIVTTSIAGEISVFSVKRQERVFYHDTMPGLIAADKAARAPPVSKFDTKYEETDDQVDLDTEKPPV